MTEPLPLEPVPPAPFGPIYVELNDVVDELTDMLEEQKKDTDEVVGKMLASKPFIASDGWEYASIADRLLGNRMDSDHNHHRELLAKFLRRHDAFDILEPVPGLVERLVAKYGAVEAAVKQYGRQ